MSCSHPALFRSLCVVCGAEISSTGSLENSEASSAKSQTWNSSLIMGGGKSLQVSSQEAVNIQASKLSGLVNSKKLALVLDLDHTLVHASYIDGKSPPNVVQSTDIEFFHLPVEETINGTIKHLLLKKRPHLDYFLEKASEFCQMTIYTAGTRLYAEAVARVIDPTNRYIGNRIVSRTDVPTARADGNDKSLSRIFLGDSSMAVILDDREDVWRGAEPQLLLVRAYHFSGTLPSSNKLANNETAGAAMGSHVAPAMGGGMQGFAIALSGNKPGSLISPPSLSFAAAASLDLPTSEYDDQLIRSLEILQSIHAKFYEVVPSVSNLSLQNSSSESANIDIANGGEKEELRQQLTLKSPITLASNNVGDIDSPQIEVSSITRTTTAAAAAIIKRPSRLRLHQQQQLKNKQLEARSVQVSVPGGLDRSVSAPRHVADILAEMKTNVLRGCVISFSGLIPVNEPGYKNHFLWKLAESLGAQVSIQVLPHTTHLLAVTTQTQKVLECLKSRASDIWVLHPDWLFYCRYALKKAWEVTFMLQVPGPGQVLPQPRYGASNSSSSSSSSGGDGSTCNSSQSQQHHKQVDEEAVTTYATAVDASSAAPTSDDSHKAKTTCDPVVAPSEKNDTLSIKFGDFLRNKRDRETFNDSNTLHSSEKRRHVSDSQKPRARSDNDDGSGSGSDSDSSSADSTDSSSWFQRALKRRPAGGGVHDVMTDNAGCATNIVKNRVDSSGSSKVSLSSAESECNDDVAIDEDDGVGNNGDRPEEEEEEEVDADDEDARYAGDEDEDNDEDNRPFYNDYDDHDVVSSGRDSRPFDDANTSGLNLDRYDRANGDALGLHSSVVAQTLAMMGATSSIFSKEYGTAVPDRTMQAVADPEADCFDPPPVLSLLPVTGGNNCSDSVGTAAVPTTHTRQSSLSLQSMGSSDGGFPYSDVAVDDIDDASDFENMQQYQRF